MTLEEWRRKNRIPAKDAAVILGMTNPHTIYHAEKKKNPRLEAFIKVVSEIPEVRFVENSSYGLPAALIGGDGTEYAPADIVRSDGRAAGWIVYLWAGLPDRTETEYQMAKKYLFQWAEGPHLR